MRRASAADRAPPPPSSCRERSHLPVAARRVSITSSCTDPLSRMSWQSCDPGSLERPAAAAAAAPAWSSRNSIMCTIRSFSRKARTVSSARMAGRRRSMTNRTSGSTVVEGGDSASPAAGRAASWIRSIIAKAPFERRNCSRTSATPIGATAASNRRHSARSAACDDNTSSHLIISAGAGRIRDQSSDAVCAQGAPASSRSAAMAAAIRVGVACAVPLDVTWRTVARMYGEASMGGESSGKVHKTVMASEALGAVCGPVSTAIAGSSASPSAPSGKFSAGEPSDC
eukprot:scaffold206489_cov28-Tisochrysis_lutea.AAC.7